jgi:hypothetical protein
MFEKSGNVMGYSTRGIFRFPKILHSVIGGEVTNTIVADFVIHRFETLGVNNETRSHADL